MFALVAAHIAPIFPTTTAPANASVDTARTNALPKFMINSPHFEISSSFCRKQKVRRTGLHRRDGLRGIWSACYFVQRITISSIQTFWLLATLNDLAGVAISLLHCTVSVTWVLCLNVPNIYGLRTKP